MAQPLKFENEITDYRRSIFVLDNIYGTCITLGGVFTLITMGFTKPIYYIITAIYLSVSLLVFLLLKNDKYQIAVYTNITISFIVLAIAILLIGNQYNFHFLFLSLGLSSFIYANNQTLNKVFLTTHCILFCVFALLPNQHIPQTVPHLATVIVLLFFLSFVYKSMLIFNLYAKTYIQSINNGLIYKSIFENAFDGILNIRQNRLTGEITSTYNTQLEELLNTNEQIVNTRQLFKYLPEAQPDGENSREKLQNSIDNLQTNNQQKLEFTFKNTQNKHINTELTVLKISDLLDDFQIFILKDISEQTRQRKTIQEQLEKLQHKNEELKKYIDSNMQLENFAYITSHDLREPLRTISGFAKLLQRKYSGELDEIADEYLGYILTSAKNMNELIQDLLIFSRVHTIEHKVDNFNTETLLTQTIQSLGSTIEDIGAIITYENIPETINANQTQMKQLFQNLIANAIKFRKPDTVPEVKITAKSKDKFWEFSVKDNGIGISEEYFDKIFMVFKRLHTKDQYEGTGIGLSLCKKIVEQHGGEIRLESEKGKGTTFYFTIEK